jgi:hypothetical protein
MRKQVEAWQRSELSDVIAKVVIYEAFVEGKLEAPKQSPSAKSFTREQSGACPTPLTSAFKEMDPIPQFRATAKLGEFLEARFSQSF